MRQIRKNAFWREVQRNGLRSAGARRIVRLSHSPVRKSRVGGVVCCLGLFFGPLVMPVSSFPATVSPVSGSDKSAWLAVAPAWADSEFPNGRDLPQFLTLTQLGAIDW